MQISQISVYSQSFNGRYSRNQMINKITEPVMRTVKDDANKTLCLAGTAVTGVTAAVNLDNILKEKGFTYYQENGNVVNLASGYNGGFFAINKKALASLVDKKLFIVQSLNISPMVFGGLLNYKDMVNDIKRQDLIQNGLRAHTYELNSSVPTENAYFAARVLSKLSNKYVMPKDLFFIENEAYYYDKLDKTAYSVNAFAKTYDNMFPTYRTCKFDIDSKGNAIGYTVSAMDLFQQKHVSKEYKEQILPSRTLSVIANRHNNKIFAESFRFGNAKPNSKMRGGILNVQEHLLTKVKIKEPKESDLQFVKFYDKDDNIISRICYYDSSIGRSFIYDENGNYRYQMEYIKDNDGRIIACSKF